MVRATSTCGIPTDPDAPASRPPFLEMPVAFLFHESLEEESGILADRDELLDALARLRRAPRWTVVVGDAEEHLAITAVRPGGFVGQYPIRTEAGHHEASMMFHGLTWGDVSAIITAFYTGRRAESCFAPYDGLVRFTACDDTDAP